MTRESKPSSEAISRQRRSRTTLFLSQRLLRLVIALALLPSLARAEPALTLGTLGQRCRRRGPRHAKMNNVQLRLFALLLGLGELAFASDDCSNPVTTAAVAVCVERNHALAEQRLNAVYGRILSALRKVDAEYARSYPERPALHAAESLVAAQRIWRVFRRESCHSEALIVLSGNPSRGDNAAITLSACEARLASARADELESLARSYDIALTDGPHARRGATAE